jgi:predicted ABC-type ATPase
MPRLYIISGCNGSGKTTATYTLLPEMLECREFVNSDEFAKSLSPFDPSAASISASRYMLLKIKYLLSKNADFSIETTLATRSLEKTIRQAKDQGYHITVLYFWLSSPELAINRVKDRVAAGGHNIPEETIRRRYYMGLHYFFNIYVPLCDRWVLADNSTAPFSVIAEGTGPVLLIKDNEKYRHIKEIASAYENVQ